jgi:hypothetical protein
MASSSRAAVKELMCPRRTSSTMAAGVRQPAGLVWNVVRGRCGSTPISMAVCRLIPHDVGKRLHMRLTLSTTPGPISRVMRTLAHLAK